MTRNNTRNVVQASSGGGLGDLLYPILRGWQRRKEIDFRFSRENEIMDKQHAMNLERDTHRSRESMLAQGTVAAIQSNFDNLLETNKHGNKIEQIGASGSEDRLTLKESGAQDRRTIGHKFKKESALKAQVHAQDTEMERLEAGNEIGRMSDENLYKQQSEDQQSGNKIKLERERGKQARRNQKNTIQTGVQGMRDISSGLAENYEDPSTGISPLVSNPGGLQNIGNSLREHPFLKPNPNAGGAAPLAPSPGGPGGSDDSGEATVTGPKIKKPKIKRTGTGG